MYATHPGSLQGGSLLPFLALGLLTALVASVAPSPVVIAGLVVVLVASTLIVRNLDWGLLLLVAVFYSNFSEVASELHGLPSISKVLVPVLLGLALLQAMLAGRPIGSIRRDGLVAMGLYGLTYIVGMFVARYPDLVTGAMSDFFKDALLALTIAALLTRAELLPRVIWMLLAVAAVVSAIGIYQHYTGTFTNEYGGFARFDAEQTLEEPGSYRLSGPLTDANMFAQILVFVVPLALERALNERRWWLRLAALAAAGLVIGAIGVTYSRGGLLALAVVVGLFVWSLPRRGVAIGWLLALLVLAAPFAPEKVVDRVASIRDTVLSIGSGRGSHDESTQGRIGEIKAGLAMFADNPWLGVGVRHYPVRFQQYSMRVHAPLRGQRRAAHSLYVQIAAERGMLGLAAFGLLLTVAARSVREAYRGFMAAEKRDYARMVLALGTGFVGYLTAAVLLHEAYSQYFWLIMGLIFALPQLLRTVAGAEHPVTAGPLPTAATLLPVTSQAQLPVSHRRGG